MIRIEAKTNENNSVGVTCSLEGETNQLITELASGAAWVIMGIAGGLAAVDDLHESLATVVCSEILGTVSRLQKEAEGKTASAGGFAPDDPVHRMGEVAEQESAVRAERTEEK